MDAAYFWLDSLSIRGSIYERRLLGFEDSFPTLARAEVTAKGITSEALLRDHLYAVHIVPDDIIEVHF